MPNTHFLTKNQFSALWDKGLTLLFVLEGQMSTER